MLLVKQQILSAGDPVVALNFSYGEDPDSLVVVAHGASAVAQKHDVGVFAAPNDGSEYETFGIVSNKEDEVVGVSVLEDNKLLIVRSRSVWLAKVDAHKFDKPVKIIDGFPDGDVATACCVDHERLGIVARTSVPDEDEDGDDDNEERTRCHIYSKENWKEAPITFSSCHQGPVETAIFFELYAKRIPVIVTGGSDGLMNVLNVNKNVDEDDRLVSSMKEESAISQVGCIATWVIYAMTHDNRAAVYRWNDSEDDPDEEGLEFLFRRKATEGRFLVGLIACNGHPTQLAGFVETTPTGDVYIVSTNGDGKNETTDYELKGGHKEMIRCIHQEANVGFDTPILATGDDNGVVCLWKKPLKWLEEERKKARAHEKEVGEQEVAVKKARIADD